MRRKFLLKVMILSLLFVAMGGGDLFAQSVTEVSDAEGLKSALTKNGTVKLTGDIEVETTIGVPYVTVTLDLNGHSIKAKSDDIYPINNDGILTITDSKGNGVIEGLGLSSGFDNNTNAKGPRSAGAELFINGGTFRNLNSETGAAVYVHQGEATINGGSFYGRNIAIMSANGTVEINGGFIDGYESAIVSSASVKIKGATKISGQCRTENGGSIFIAPDVTVTYYQARIGNANNWTSYETLAEAVQAAKLGDEVYVFAGTYAVPSVKAGITINGEVDEDGKTKVLLEGTLSGTLENVTLKNLHIKGDNAQRWGYAKGDLYFENVTFEATSVYAIHFDGITEGANLLYKNCTIIGWAAMSGSPVSCKFEKCTIKDNGTYGVIRTYFDATIANCTFDIRNANPDDVYQDGIHAVSGADVVVTGCTNVNGDMKDIVNVSGSSTVEVDGVLIQNPVKVGENYYATIQEAIVAAAPSGIVKLVTDVTVDKWIMFSERLSIGNGNIITKEINGLTIDGDGHTLTINSIESAGNGNRLFYDATELNIKDLTIKCVDAAANQGGIGLTSGTISNVNFIGGGPAILPGTGEITVTGCTFKTNGTSIYYEEARDNLVVNGNTFANPDGVNVILLRGNTKFTNNIINSGRTVNVVSGSPVVSGNDFKDVRFKVYNAAEATISNNTINDLEFNDESVVYSIFGENTLSQEAQAVLDAASFRKKVATKAELNAAISAAKEGDIIEMTADIDYGTDQLKIEKAITLDLGGNTLTTRNAYGGMSIKNNPTIKNGNIVHASNTAAIKVWNATAFEDLVIDVQGKGDANKTIGGIVLQEGNKTRVGSIKNVTIKGDALTNGIETYNCGNATENVIGAMENVTINAVGTAMLISAPCGTAKNCTFNGGVNGVEIWIKGTYSASLDLVDCDVVGGVFAHDEFNTNPGVVNNGTLTLTADEATTGAAPEDVTLTIARAENLAGVIKEVMDNAKAKINDTYYLTLQAAINAAVNDQTITLIVDNINENVTVTQAPDYAITIDGADKTFKGTITVDGKSTRYETTGLTIKNVNFDATEGISTDACINLGVKGNTNTRYTDNVTVESCTFTDNDNAAVAIKSYTGGDMNLTVIECTATGMHSLAQLANVNGLKISDCNVNCARGIALGSSNDVTISGCKINASNDKYGVRADADVTINITIEDSEISAFIPVVVRDVKADASLTFNGTNTFTAANTDGLWCAIGYSEYETNGVMPEAPATGYVSVTLNDENLDVNGIYNAISGNGSENEPYYIKTVADLKFFRDQVNGGNNYAGKYVKLAADIDLNNENWTPIGNITYNSQYKPADASKVFSGVFDGNGKVISNLKIERTVGGADTQANVGFFGMTGEGAVIKNLTLTGVNINTDGRNVGALIGYTYMATIDNITVNGNIQINGGNNVSGVGGMSRHHAMSAANINVIGNDGSTIVGNNIVGGIFAEIAPNGSAQTFENLSVENVAITGVGGVGGIVGLLTTGTVNTVSVKNVALTGRTDYLGNAMGRIRLGSVAGLMGGEYATIANATTENVTAKNLDGNTVVLPIIGANYSGNIGNATEAKIGDTYYATLQTAIDAAKAGDNTIQLLADITGNVTILQKEGVNIVIDGKKAENENYQFDGTIYVDGNNRHTGAEKLTIQNVNFYTVKTPHDFISANVANQYTHNVTVKGCNFATSETYGNNEVVGLRLRQAYNIAVKNCTSNHIFSLMWSTGVVGLDLNEVTVNNCTEGISIGGKSQNVTITGYNITSPSFGIRASVEGGQFTMTNSTIDALVPVVVRNENNITDLAQYTLSFTFNETNNIVESNPTNYWFVAGETEYKGADEVMPTAPKGQVSVTLNDTGLRYEDVYGNYYELAGEGTANNPYTIANLYELKFFRDQVNAGNNYAGKYVKLTADIDLAEGQTRSTESNWEPIGWFINNNNNAPFNGIFDGDSKTISNLVINGGSSSNQGFFGFTTNGEIKNLTFNNAKVSGRLNVGVVAGTPYTSKYTNIKVTGRVEVNGMSYVGGVGGKNAYANWTDITVDVDGESYVKATSTENGTSYRTYVGGVIGFNGEGGHTFKNISSNINVIGDVCDIGGIFGIAHYGNKFEDITHTGTVTNTNSNAEDVVETGLIAGVWHNQAGTSVTFTNTTSTGTISVPNVTGVTFPNDGLIGAAYTTSNETSSTSGSLTINGEQVYPYVAKIGEVGYNTLAKAITAAQNEDVVTLLWVEGDAPIAMNASLYGKNVTITGTATVDWSKGWLFVGRGGAGDATLTFDNAKLTSNEESLANGTYGIHVSAKEGNDVNKNYGKVIFKNSDVQLSYLANRNDVEVDGGKLYVHYGFWVGGRPSTETPDGSEGTATMDIKNGAVVEVNNHNGMGIGHEGNGVMNITSSTFKYTGTSFNLAKEENSSINVYGESTIEITKLEGGSSIDLMDGAIVKNSTIGGDVFVAGNVTFRGDNTFAMLYDYGTLTGYYGTTANMEWTVEEGASLTLTKMARYGLGYGDNVTINGSITNALEARENLTEDDRSLFMHGLVAQESSGYNCNSKLTVNNAYVVLGSNNSFGNKPGEYGGNYTINFKNSVVDASRITFYEASSITEFTFEDSDVKIGTFMTRDTDSKFTLKNSKVLSTATNNGTDEGNYNAGELTLDKSSLTYSAAFTNTGTLNLDLSSKLTAPSVAGNGTINIDATDFEGNEICVISANMASFEGVINVEGAHYMKKDNGIYVTGAQGTLTKAYTSATGYWGECGGNANESFVFKFFNDDTYMGQTSLNDDVDNIIDGDVYVSWSIKLDAESNTDPYWTMSWDIRPTLAMQPNRVEQWIDGVKVAECAVEPNWADNIFPVVAAVTGENDVILSYVNNTTGATLKDAFAAGGNVTILRDFNLSETVTVPTDKTVVLDLNGKAIAMTNNIITTTYAINNLGTLTIEDSSTDKTGSVSARGIYNGYDADGNNVATAKITIEGGTFNARGENGGAAVYNYGIADIKGGKFTSVGSYSLNNQSGASMTIADGVEATGGIYNSGATLTVNGGKISNSRKGAHTIYSWDSNVTLKDGEIHNENSNNATIFADGTSEVNIVDGTFTIKVVDASSSYLIDTDSKLNISGGEFTGGIRVQANGNMSITEGTYHNNHGNYNVYDGGSLVISGGTFCENAKTFVEDNLAQGYALKELANGYYTVIQVAGTQTREFATRGWHWFSTYINYENGEEGLDELQEQLDGNAATIKGQTAFTNYQTYNGNNFWTSGNNSLTSISASNMYMIRTINDNVSVSLEGGFVDYEQYEISIHKNWNWIGYPLNTEVNVADALVGFTPENGDQIKGKIQGQTSTYISILGGWTPNFAMMPGEGYMYYSKADDNKSLVYRTGDRGNHNVKTSVENNHWIVDEYKYSSNMTVTAMLSIDGEIVKDNYEVAAFVNGECRGSARPIYIEALDAYMLFMTIQGEDVENLTFKYYDVNYGTEYELNNTMVYSNDAIVGTIEEPYMFNLGILNIDETSVDQISIYPNPTTTGKEINLQAMCDKVEVFNALGVKVAEYTNVDSIDAIETAGIYVIRVTIDGNARNCRLVVR